MIAQTLGHYRVLEKIGEGGMGIVFRARDEQLDREVALKILPNGTLADEPSRKQFRTEALALAKLSHPNIETVFEFNSQDGIDFLALELIPGITLKEKLKDGPLPQKEVLRLGMQLAEGLAAAHSRGVIHRDLKPANLFITADGRLKILDFGLAKFAKTGFGSEVTETFTTDHSKISGTVPYMSPEQLSGLPLDPRSDIYSSGVILYEMATGARPFSSAQGARLIGAILHQTPAPPSSLNPLMSPGLESVISKTLEKEPAQRYRSAGELSAALSGVTASNSAVIESGIRPAQRKPLPGLNAVVAGVVLLVLAFSIALGLNVEGLRGRILHAWRPIPNTSSTLIAPVAARRSIAVLGLKSVSVGTNQPAVSTGLELDEMLTTDFAAGGQLRTIPQETVAGMEIGLSLPNANSYGPATLQKIRENLNADYVILGSYMPLDGGQIRLDLTLENASTGEIVDAVSVKGKALDELANRAAAELRAKLGVAPVSATDVSEAKAVLSSNPQAERLYAEGLAKMRSFDNLAGRDLLQKAVAIDPQFALAHSALARAWKDLGYDPQAETEAKKAFDLSAALPRENRLQVEGQYRETTGDWDKAIDTYRSLFTFYPDNVEYGILLAQVQRKAGKGKDAIATADSLRSLPSPSGQDVRIDLMAAEASFSIGNIKQMQSLAVSAANKARANGAKWLLARALFLAGLSDENLGQTKDAIAAEQESSATYEAAGDRNGVASSLEVQGNVFVDQGDLADAFPSYSKELSIAREVGNKQVESSALNNLGLILQEQGDPIAAQQMYEQALTGFRKIGDRKNSAMSLLNVGEVLQEEGNLAKAQRTYEQALNVSREVNDKKGVGGELTVLGSVLDEQGDLASAKRTLEQAIAVDLESGQKTGSDDKLVGMGDVLRDQGNLALAEKSYNDALQLAKATDDTSNAAWAYVGLGSVAVQRADFQRAQSDYGQALTIRDQIGEKNNARMTRVAMAALAIEEGHSDQAIADLGPIRDDLRKEDRTSDELIATSLLIKSFLARAKVEEAKRELETAEPVVRKNQSVSGRLELAIDKALVRLASGSPALAIPILNEVLSESKRDGFLQYQFEARLALGEAALKSGRSAEGRTDLKKLQADATEKNFNLIAQKAAALSN
jgi:eukaryotic-like serine/threonine-protein kinase